MLTALVAVLLLSSAPTSADCDSGMSSTGGCASIVSTLGEDGATLEGLIQEGGAGTVSSGGSRPIPSYCLVPEPPEPCLRGAPTTLTLSDIASFRPDVGTNAMQPNGWAVVGLDTNFFSRGGADVVDGSLLGGPAQVRFTPIAWSWSYGDGTATRATTAGGTWEELGIPEFDATPTSHAYTAKGTYTITLTIDYAAEYRLGDAAWVRIPGVLSLPANPLTITVGSAKTVLVDEDCRVNPSGPGC